MVWGHLQWRHGDYIKFLQFVYGIGVKQRRAYAHIKADQEKQFQNVGKENDFLVAGHTKARDSYESKQKLFNVSEESLFALAWDVERYSKLIEKNAAIKESITSIIAKIDDPVSERGNIPADVSTLKKKLQPYIKGVNTKKR